MRISIGWVVVAVIGACKGGSSTATSSAGSSTGSAVLSAPIDARAPAPDAETLSGPMAIVTTTPTCKPKCQYAAQLPLVQAIAKHAAECKADWYAPDDCEGLLYARNCIYAAYGNVFKTAAWKDRFTKEPWYKPNPKFREQDLPAFAMDNIKALKKQYEACSTPIPPVTPEDQKLAADTYERVIIKEEVADGIDAQDLESARESHRNLYLHETTTYEYDGAPKDGRRTIVIGGLYKAVGPGELMPDAAAVLTFEGDKLVEVR